MLKVRYGSGWSRRQTASAARPSACKSRQSKRAAPSSQVNRSPSTALRKLRSMVQFKIYPPPGKAKLTGQGIKMVQPGQLAWPQVKMQDVGKVPTAEAGVQS